VKGAPAALIALTDDHSTSTTGLTMSIKVAAASEATKKLSEVSRDLEFSAVNRVITGKTMGGLDIEAFGSFAPDPQKLLCFLPSAQPRNAAPQVPFFPRWSWASEFSAWDVLSFSDPLLPLAPSLPASWFATFEEDVIGEFARFIRGYCTKRGIKTEDVILYGSSMGGYGSLMIAAELQDSHAVAEVPQLDLLRYPDSTSLADVESLSLGGRPLNDLATQFPHRTDVYARLQSTKCIPPMTIITNRSDSAFQETLDFVAGLHQLAANAESVGPVMLHQTPRSEGHAVQPTPYMIRLLKSIGGIPPQVAKYYPTFAGTQERLEFPQWDFDNCDSWGERELKESVAWIKHDNATELAVEFSAINPGAGTSKGIVFCVAVHGTSPEEMALEGFMFSHYRSVGYFKYVALPDGTSAHDIRLSVPVGAMIKGIGLAAWDVKAPVIRDLRLS
jgi:hypothetical protein